MNEQELRGDQEQNAQECPNCDEQGESVDCIGSGVVFDQRVDGPGSEADGDD